MPATVRTAREGSGTNYEIEGTFDEVTEAIEKEKGSWPPAGYGTWFNWPPGRTYEWPEASKGKPITYRAATDLGEGRWIGRGHRSNSCD